MEDLIPYIVMPFVVAFVGWATNVVGLQMMFYPVQWRGVGKSIGWQGIIPRIRERFTRDLVTKTVVKVCTPAEMLNALNDDDALGEMSVLIRSQIEEAVDDFMQSNGVKLWSIAPDMARQRVYKRILHDIPSISRLVIREITENREYLLDIETLAVSRAKERPEILGELILSMFGTEFRFMKISGLYIGFPLGCLQALCWYFMPINALLPLFGCLVGALTNWIALNILAYPARGVKFLNWELQGLVLKRQKDVSLSFAEVFTEKFLNTKDVLEFIWDGERGDEIKRMIKRQLRNHMESKLFSKGIDLSVRLASRDELYDEKALKVLESNIFPLLDNSKVSRTLVKPVQMLLTMRMQQMPPEQFQELFLPIFQHDKWLVIIVGAMLGGAAGLLQLLVLFSDGPIFSIG
ncbi:DUF445 domain-containing protein [Zhongshania aliphaticivorans]|uniref:DUF445 domain-containing protein n=1 Tax=Zhongshania aliphaticivorans TaxID=1470434 RepID=A0A127M222_9GAMM|nr:hypothetical protein [Zhongshania aliphaticivorans]AMO67259.1 hypothetical protein AZF00_02625 [Zhongshania aliphaticivorans]